VNGPAGPAPVRRAASIRRTSTLDGTWPGGWGTQLRIEGRARDAVTHAPVDAPVVLETARTSVGIGAARMIEEITTEPSADGVQSLVGCRGGGYLRAALAEFVPDELARGTPLYLLLDDLSGVSLVAGVAWTAWPQLAPAGSARPPRADMEGVCIGFAPGSAAIVEVQQTSPMRRSQVVGPLVHPHDPYGWHTLADLPPVSFRRARRIEVWRDPLDGTILVDAAFQDTAGHPDHGRVAIHEYLVRATADPGTLLVTSIEADPRVLPFVSCPNAVDTARRVEGTPLADLRTTVLERLAKTHGCTHLNDALRALAEVPLLLARLDAEIARRT
jgi:hypothetical protein